MKLAQSSNHNLPVHVARDRAETTLCGYRLGRTWEVGWRKIAKPPFPNVSCKRCRRLLGAAALTEEQRKQALLRAVVQLQDLVRLGAETGTLRFGRAVGAEPPEGGFCGATSWATTAPRRG